MLQKKVKNKLTVTEILQKIKDSQMDYKDSTGLTALLYFDKQFQKVFADAVVKHGTNGNKVHQEVKKMLYNITPKQIQKYLRRLFGGYEKKGRPSKYMQNEIGRKFIRR